VQDNHATGVRLTNGEVIKIAEDGLVASNVDPFHLIADFLGEEIVGGELVAKMRRYEWGDAYMIMYLALDARSPTRPARTRSAAPTCMRRLRHSSTWPASTPNAGAANCLPSLSC
jgi:hypothetical protein